MNRGAFVALLGICTAFAAAQETNFVHGSVEMPTSTYEPTRPQVRWRQDHNLGSWLSNALLREPGYPWDGPSQLGPPEWMNRDVFGIHATLLPRPMTDVDGSVLPRGTVILWGRGQFFVSNPGPEEKFVNWCSYMLWNPAEHPNPALRERFKYGRVRFRTDPLPNGDKTDRLHQGNLFCSGHTLLEDGRLFVAGGHYPNTSLRAGSTRFEGIKAAYIFDLQGLNWNTDPFGWSGILGDPGVTGYVGMAEPRWYPTCLTLPDGRVLIVGGVIFDSSGYTQTYEVFDPYHGPDGLLTAYSLKSLKDCPDTFSDRMRRLGNFYPRLHTVTYPDLFGNLTGSIVYTGPDVPTHRMDPYKVEEGFDCVRGTHDKRVYRFYGSSVLLPRVDKLNPQNAVEQSLPTVVTLGGSAQATCSTWATAEILEYHHDRLKYYRVPEMDQARQHINAVLLPNSEMFVFGGQKKSNDFNCKYEINDIALTSLSLTPDPVFGWYRSKWEMRRTMDSQDRDANLTVDGARTYHSSGLLLPDGSVLMTGTNLTSRPTMNNTYPAIYKPPYFYKPDNALRSANERPRILSINPSEELDYGQIVSMSAALPSADWQIQSVSLMRPGSATHAWDNEQRMIRLKYEAEHLGNGQYSLQVTAPFDPLIAPPGWYMVFLTAYAPDAGGMVVPSVAGWIQVKRQTGDLMTLSIDGAIEGASYEVEVASCEGSAAPRRYTANATAVAGGRAEIALKPTIDEPRFEVRVKALNGLLTGSAEAVRRHASVRLSLRPGSAAEWVLRWNLNDPATDLNRDGKVSDDDLALAMAAFQSSSD